MWTDMDCSPNAESRNHFRIDTSTKEIGVCRSIQRRETLVHPAGCLKTPYPQSTPRTRHRSSLVEPYFETSGRFDISMGRNKMIIIVLFRWFEPPF